MTTLDAPSRGPLPIRRAAARPLAWAILAALVGLAPSACSKKNTITQGPAETQSGTCTTACQKLASLEPGADKSSSVWCGRDFTSAVKGGGLTKCIDRCASEITEQATIECTTGAPSCAAVDTCGFFLPPT